MPKYFFTAAALLVSAFSFAQRMPADRRKLEGQRDSLQQAIAAVKRSLSKTHQDKQASLSQLALLERRLSLREAAIGNTDTQIRYIQSDMEQSDREIGQLRQELDTLRARYAASIIFTYKNRHDADLFHLIFSSASLYEAVQRVEYLRAFHEYEEERAENIRRTEGLLKGKVEGLKYTEGEKNIAMKRQRSEVTMLEEEKKEKDAYLLRLRSREKDLRGEMMKRQRLEERLSADIALSIRRAGKERRMEAVRERTAERKNTEIGRKKEPTGVGALSRKTDAVEKMLESAGVGSKEPAGAGSKNKGGGLEGGSTTPANIGLTGSFESCKGRLPWPVESRTIAAAFGLHTYMPGLKHDNPGITIAVDAGAVVRAVAEGIVQDVYPDVDAVVIRHGSYLTTYSNLTGIAVTKGEDIKAGQVIGRVSAGGQMDFWLTDEKGRMLDPEKWLRR